MERFDRRVARQRVESKMRKLLLAGVLSFIVAQQLYARDFDTDDAFDLTRCLTAEEGHDVLSEEGRIYVECLIIRLNSAACVRKLTHGLAAIGRAGLDIESVAESIEVILNNLLIGPYEIKRQTLRDCANIDAVNLYSN